MNLLTICFTSIIHIILVLIFEGILLFVILLPLINGFVSNAVKESNYSIISNQIFLTSMEEY